MTQAFTVTGKPELASRLWLGSRVLLHLFCKFYQNHCSTCTASPTPLRWFWCKVILLLRTVISILKRRSLMSQCEAASTSLSLERTSVLQGPVVTRLIGVLLGWDSPSLFHDTARWNTTLITNKPGPTWAHLRPGKENRRKKGGGLQRLCWGA